MAAKARVRKPRGVGANGIPLMEAQHTEAWGKLVLIYGCGMVSRSKLIRLRDWLTRAIAWMEEGE